jgi:ribokinase
MADIVVLGGLNLDLVVETDRLPQPGETIEGHRFYTSGGGKGANQAVAAARLSAPGTTVRMIGRVGDDPHGHELLALLRNDGVNCDGVAVVSGERSGFAVILIDAAGENTVLPIYGTNAGCDEQQIDALQAVLGGASVLLLQQEIPLATTAEAMAAAADRGVRILLDPAPARDSLPPGFHSQCDILTPNQIEAQALTGHPIRDAAAGVAAAAALRASGISGAIVTLGANGVVVDVGNERASLPGHLVRPIASVGAGDAFNGALAVGLAEGRSVIDAATFANAAAALSVTHAGVQESMPSRAEAEALVTR